MLRDLVVSAAFFLAVFAAVFAPFLIVGTVEAQGPSMMTLGLIILWALSIALVQRFVRKGRGRL